VEDILGKITLLINHQMEVRIKVCDIELVDLTLTSLSPSWDKFVSMM